MILGRAGRNFAAGMSGGIAYVWDVDGDFSTRCNMEMVELFSVETDEGKKELRGLIENHYNYTQSTVAKYVLDNWEVALPQFVKIYPTDYRRVLEEKARTREVLKSGAAGFENEGCFEE